MKITRLIAVQRCGQNNSCPAVLALDNGDFLVIGKVPTEPHLLDDLTDHGTSIGPDEMAVIVPRDVLLSTARQVITGETREMWDKRMRRLSDSELSEGISHA